MALDTFTSWPAGPTQHSFAEGAGYAYDPEANWTDGSAYARSRARWEKEATGGLTFFTAPAGGFRPVGEPTGMEVLSYLAAPAAQAERVA